MSQPLEVSMKNYIVEYILNGKLEEKLTCVSTECKPLLDAAVKTEEAVNAVLTDKQKIAMLL